MQAHTGPNRTVFEYFNSSLLDLKPSSSNALPGGSSAATHLSLPSAVDTVHALVELIEVSQAHRSRMGAMCCAVCQPVSHV